MRFVFINKKGLASLPTVLAIGMLILAIGVSVAAVAFSENLVAQKFSQSPRALFYAESGARDALQKIARNKNFVTAPNYQMEFVTSGCSTNDGCAIISVGANGNVRTVTSTGKYKSIIRQVRVDATLDSGSNGEIQNVNWQEITN